MEYKALINSKRIGIETFIYIPVFLVPAIVNIVTLSLFTRIFPPKLYGEYSLVINTTIIISSLLGQWVVLSIQRFRPEYRLNENLAEFNLFLNRLLIQLSLAFIFLSIVLYLWIPNHFKGYYLPSVISVVLSVFFMVLGAVYQIDLLSRKYRNINLIQAIGKLPVILLLLYVVSYTPEQFIWGTAIMQLIILYPMLRYIEIERVFSFNREAKQRYKEYIKTFFVYGFPLIGWYIGTTVLNLTDRYMIQFYRGSHEVGIYSANFTIAVQALALICNPLFFAVQPLIMNQVNASKKETELLIAKYTKIYILLAVPFGIYFSIFRNEVSSFLLGEQFVTGASVIWILIGGFFFWNLGLYGQLTCQIDKRTRHMFYFVSVAAVVNFLLNMILIPLFGYVGASIATGIGFLTYSILLVISSIKHTKWIVPWGDTLKIISLGLCIAMPIEWGRRIWFYQSGPFITMLTGTIYFLLYLFMLVILKEISPRPVINMLKSRWRT